MLQNVNPEQMYVPQCQLPQMMPGLPQQLPIPCVAPYPAIQQGVMPVYNSIPYAPVYGNYGQPQSQGHKCMPDIQAVKIELNGIETPKVPGYNDYSQQAMPMYPGYTQMCQAAPPFSPYQAMPQMTQMSQYMPQITQPVGNHPIPPAIPSNFMVGATPPPPQLPIQQASPQALQQPQQVISPPPPAIEQMPKANVQTQIAQQPQQSVPAPTATVDKTAKIEAAPPVSTQQQDQESIKPLLDALNAIYPPQGAPAPTIEQQGKAVETIAQFTKIAVTATQLSKTDPNNADVKQAKEKVDNLIKPNLIKEETFLGLVDIANKDTSALTGDQKKNADEARIISLFTLSMLQKYFKQEINEEAKKVNLPLYSMNEVPGIVQVVNIAMKDPDPNLRGAAITGLNNIADPKDKKDAETMKTILSEAIKDKSEDVKNLVADCMKLYQEPEKKAA